MINNVSKQEQNEAEGQIHSMWVHAPRKTNFISIMGNNHSTAQFNWLVN